MDKNKQSDHEFQYAKLSLVWSGWGSPVGLGIGLVSVGVFLWMLHLANIIK